MERARVAIVIPAFNSGAFLGEALESARAQTHPAAEIIVVDDGSSDDSVAIASSFAGVRVIPQSNQGVCGARNRALAESRAELVIFHDADDRLLPAAIEIGVRALAGRPACGLAYGFSRPIRADGSPIPTRAPQPVAEASYASLLAGDALAPPSSAIFRRAAVDAVGGFDQRSYPTEDYDFYLRIARDFGVHCHNEFVVEYRQHAANASALSAARQLRAALATLDEQLPFVRGDPELEGALRRGRRHWARVFGPGAASEVLRSLKRGQLGDAARTLALVLAHHPQGLATVARLRLDLLRGRSR